jgi:RNA polymerase sigma factor (TIGR02999 family)
MSPRSDISQLLLDWNNGDKGALNRLVPLVYEELHRLAEHYIRRERPNHTLQPTALINEAYIRLIDIKKADWKNRAHFFGVAARLMREILVDYARARAAQKRGGFVNKIPLEQAGDLPGMPDVDLLALDAALRRLDEVHPLKCRIVELRFFGGLSNEEIAEVLGVSIPTVVRHWRVARAWLYSEIRGASHDS